jgi:hypothetical protein
MVLSGLVYSQVVFEEGVPELCVCVRRHVECFVQG